MERGLISFFEVEGCGFYRRMGKESVHVEGSLKESMSILSVWLDGRDFTKTIPWDIDKFPRRTNIYAKTIATDEHTQDTVFVLWKQYGDDSGKISGISPSAKFGSSTEDSVKIGTTVKGGKAILGDPMYYWFIPEYNVIASINFSHSSASTEEVCDYIKRCIDLRIAHPRKKITENTEFDHTRDKTITRQNVNYLSEDGKFSLKFKFRAKTKTISSANSNIKKLSENITHLIMRDTISAEVEKNKDSLFKFYDLVTGAKRTKKVSKEVEITEAVRLSEEELTAIFKIYDDEYDPDTPWNDIGFKETGSTTTRFLSKYLNRERILLPKLAAKQTYYSAEELLSVLLHERESLLYSVRQNAAPEFQAENAEEIRAVISEEKVTAEVG